MTKTVWVSLPWATFGLVITDGVVADAAPVARRFVGQPEARVAGYYRRLGAVFWVLPGGEG